MCIRDRRSLSYRKTYGYLIILIHLSTNGDKLVKFAPVLVEIFVGICQFLPSRQKRCSCYPHNLWVTGPLLIIFAHDVVQYFWIGTAILECQPVEERSFCQLCIITAYNWLLWQCPLMNWNKEVQMDPEIIGVRAIIKKEERKQNTGMANGLNQ